MANVTRERTSKDGATRGLNGINIPPQKYIVEFTDASEYSLDPTVILQGHADGVPLGAAYEFDSFAAICSGYQIGAPLGHSGWEVYALYTPVTIATSGWRANIRGFIDTEHIVESVEENQDQQQIIGGRIYFPATQSGPPFPPDATHTALTLTNETLYLVQSTRREEKGWDVPKPGMSLYLYRDDLPATFNISNVWAAANYLGKVNNVTFWGQFPVPGTVLMTEIALEELPGPAVNEVSDYGYHYGAQLRFDIRPASDRFSPVRIFDAISDDDQNKSFVYLINGGKVWTDFVVIKPADLNGVFPFLSP